MLRGLHALQSLPAIPSESSFPEWCGCLLHDTNIIQGTLPNELYSMNIIHNIIQGDSVNSEV